MKKVTEVIGIFHHANRTIIPSLGVILLFAMRGRIFLTCGEATIFYTVQTKLPPRETTQCARELSNHLSSKCGKSGRFLSSLSTNSTTGSYETKETTKGCGDKSEIIV